MHLEIIDCLDGLRRRRADWDAVYAADPEAQVFLSHTWIAGWFEHHDAQWLVLAAKATPDSSDYLGFLPLYLRTELTPKGFINELGVGGGYFAGYNGLIVRPEHAGPVIAAFTQAVRSLRWARFQLENLLLSPGRMRRIFAGFKQPGLRTSKVRRPDDGDGIDHDIYVQIPLDDDWEQFLASRIGAKTRANARRTLRQVDGSDEFRVSHATAETLEGDLDILLRFWDLQWTAKLAALYKPALPLGMMHDFRRMFRCCFADGALLLLILWRGDTPIGAQASLLDHKNRSVLSMAGGRDMSVKRPPPGFALHLYSLRWAIEQGYRTYDLLTGDFEYKHHLGGQERRVECFKVTTADGRNPGHRLDPRSTPRVLAWARSELDAGRMMSAEMGVETVLRAEPGHAEALRLKEQLALPRPAPPAAAPKAAPVLQVAPAPSLQEQIRRAIEKRP